LIVSVPLSVNLVLTRKCNYNCKFCFGGLSFLDEEPNIDRILEIPYLLKQAGCEKITFEGGEPFLFNGLVDLVKVSKDVGLTTSIISNGSLITRERLIELALYLDWLGLSIDSQHERVEKQLGRGNGGHIEKCVRVAKWARESGIRLKINTVVTSLNYNEDLTGLLGELRPDRWKAFQVLGISNELNQNIGELSINEEQFKRFIEINKKVRKTGIPFVPESNGDMMGSYIMLLPDGKFFSNEGSLHRVSKSNLFDVGVNNAFAEVGWSEERFLGRGGLYDWENPASGIRNKDVII